MLNQPDHPLIIHPDHPNALAMLDENGTPQFVAAQRVIELVDGLNRRIAELEEDVFRLRGGIRLDSFELSCILCNQF